MAIDGDIEPPYRQESVAFFNGVNEKTKKRFYKFVLFIPCQSPPNSESLCLASPAFAKSFFSFRAFSQNKISFSEESWSGESFKLSKVSTPEGKKSDVSLELNIEEAFPPDEFDELYGEELEEVYDPLEPFNRRMWDFNNKLYDYALEPVAKGISK